MSNNIVTVQVSQQIAPTPNTLQKFGAFVSQGATTLAAQATQILTQLSDLTPLLTGALSVTGIVRASTTATATTAAPHGYTISDVVQLTIAGASQPQYNGNFACTITGASTFTYTVSGSPTTPATGTIVWTPEDVQELLAMATTFFAQGSGQAAYVLELGEGTAAEGVVNLTTYITANPNANYTPGATNYFYAYMVPRYWANEATFVTFLGNYNSTTAKTYFYVTMTTGNYTSFTNLMKCVIGLVEAAGIGVTEFSLAAVLQVRLNYAPSSTNKVPPLAFTFLTGVTPYPLQGTATVRTNLKAANVNIIGTGAEGGVSNALILWGTSMDGRPANYWYSVDWIQVNVDLNISNAVINGSNNPVNPLYYNQDGINRLQKVGANTLTSAVTFGMALGTVQQTALLSSQFSANLAAGLYNGKLVINAIPFIPYNQASPGDYKNGEYDGFSILYVAQNGFVHLLFNIVVTDFVAQ